MKQELITKIALEAAARRLSPRTLCREAGLGGNFLDRLESGRSCTLATVEKFELWVANNPRAPEEAA